jgi:P-type Ca2+ transporter type 2C
MTTMTRPPNIHTDERDEILHDEMRDEISARELDHVADEVAVPETKATMSQDNQINSDWHARESEAVLASLESSSQGLREDEIESRRARFGANELVERGLKSPWAILWEQATAVMILVLVGAAAIKAFVAIQKGEPREWIDAGAIMAIVVLNVLLGFFQEYRAEKAMVALKKMAAPLVRVRRDGQLRDVPSRELVPGDVVLFEAGNVVPADCRVLESANLRAQEASLTGESLPVDKTVAALKAADVPLGDRSNMLWMGTSITYGRGVAVVADTGMKTQLGRIAELIQDVHGEKTPLQRRIAQLGVMLALAVAFVVAVMFALGVSQGRAPLEMFLAAVAVAVAAIPEGLPAVMTITLALGAQRMLKRRALIRKLPAVETLGSVTVICSDKTGTLTENKMRVVTLDVAGHTTDVSESVRDGHPVLEVGEHQSKLVPEHAVLLAAGALCNDAILQPSKENAGEMTVIGDPTEGAILVASARFGWERADLEKLLPRVSEAPFSSERKRMTTVHRRTELPAQLRALAGYEPFVALVKGSPDGVLDQSNRALVNGEIRTLTDTERARINGSNNQLAQQGLRVLGLAFREAESIPGNVETLENDLVFVGLFGMIDPPRAEVKDAVEKCLQAGIRPIMITGDHPLTALEIARQLKIAPRENSEIMTGVQLSKLSTEELENVVERVHVYARVSPENKLQIVEALQKRGHVVAMTGDGVNDAPALRRANIGVAMGITGTDVSKEASDMVITDDNFATIVRAVEEGRTIYDNVRKFVKYIVTSNSAEVAVMFACAAFAMPMPMSTLQILWMNLVTDGVPGLALGLEPTERDTMKRKPFAPNESIFSRGIGKHIVAIGFVLAFTAFSVGYWAYQQWGPLGPWGTMVFMTLTLSQLGHSLAVRSNSESLFKIGLRGNPLLLWAVLLTLLLQLCVVYVPFLQNIFGTQALSLNQLLLCLGLSTTVFWAVEIEKWMIRRASGSRFKVQGSKLAV